MKLYVNATDWSNLSDTAKISMERVLREHQFLEQDQDILPTINYPSLLEVSNLSLLDPELATNLRQAVSAGLEACSIIHQVCWHGEVKETSFLVVYQESLPP